MKNINILDQYPLDILHKYFNECSISVGGKNRFLQLLETIREEQRHPLLNKTGKFYFPRGFIIWSKPIFREKLDILNQARLKCENGNIYPKAGIKGAKKLMNLIRTLKPITFEIHPHDELDGSGFSFQAFDKVDEGITIMNPIFEAIFFAIFAAQKLTLSMISFEIL